MPVFTYVERGAHDPAAGTFGTASVETWSGSLVQVSGGSDEYLRMRAAGVTEDRAVVLLFVPDRYEETGSLPRLGSTVPWGGEQLTLVQVLKIIAPDGVPIAARLGCVR